MRSKNLGGAEVVERHHGCRHDSDKHFEEAKLETNKDSVHESVHAPTPRFLTPANSLEDLDEDDEIDLKIPELSHFSEEGIADMDIPEELLDELEYLDNITSCDKVENYLMLEEYEQNLIKEIEGPPTLGKRARKWSLVRQASSLFNQGENWIFEGG